MKKQKKRERRNKRKRRKEGIKEGREGGRWLKRKTIINIYIHIYLMKIVLWGNFFSQRS